MQSLQEMIVLFLKQLGIANWDVARFPLSKCFSAASLLAAIDSTADPCQNFFQYACGSWNKKHIIPEDRSSISTFEVMADQLQVILKGERPSDDLVACISHFLFALFLITLALSWWIIEQNKLPRCATLRNENNCAHSIAAKAAPRCTYTKLAAGGERRVFAIHPLLLLPRRDCFGVGPEWTQWMTLPVSALRIRCELWIYFPPSLSWHTRLLRVSFYIPFYWVWMCSRRHCRCTRYIPEKAYVV